MAETAHPGRRRAARTPSRRPAPLNVLAVVIPLLTVAVLALVRPADNEPAARPPTTADLARSTVVCPAAPRGSEPVSVANASGVSGEAVLRSLGDEATLDLSGSTTTRRERGPVVVIAEQDLASGLVASRAGDGRAVVCVQPAPEQWFTGVGASAEHASTLSLVNPDKGPAVADVTVLGPQGVLDVPQLRGVRVTGGRTTTFDLSQVVPSREALALSVAVTRGRLGVSVLDLVETLGRGDRHQEWLPAQTEPAATSYVVGLGGRPGDRTLTVANPSDDQARVELRLVSDESEFAPAGLDEIEVAPQSVVEVDLSMVLRGRVGGDVRALRLDATSPVTSALRTIAGGDMSLAVAGAHLSHRSAVALPRGPKRLVLAGADAPGVLTWRATDVDGRRVGEDRVEIDPATASRIPLPSRATLVDVQLERTGAVAVVEVGPPGLAVLPLVELVTTAEVPHVRPALQSW